MTGKTCRTFVIALAFLLMGCGGAAAEEDIVLAQNGVPDVCVPVFKALQARPEYLVYDPLQDRSALADNGTRMSSGDTLMLGNKYVVQPIWSDGGPPLSQRPLTWAVFLEDDKEKFNELWDEGEAYGITYAAYRTYANIYGFVAMTTVEPLYKLVPKNRRSAMKLPAIHMKRGSSLAAAVNNLKANDVIQYGPRIYPVVRQPGQVDLYQIDADDLKLPYEQEKFSSKLVCSIQSVSTLAKHPPADTPGK